MYTMIPYRVHRDLSAHRMNDLFDDRIFRPFFDMSDMMAGSMGFKVDIKETKDAYQLEAEMPGVKQDQIDLSVDDDVLTISCDMKHEENEENKEEHYCYSERRYGHMSRSFNLEGIDQNAIKADYHDGILSVILPKAEPEKKPEARKIAIGEGAQKAENA